MSSLSRVYTFFHDKIVSPVKLEIELSSIINTWNNHEQGIQQHSGLWTGWFRAGVSVKTSAGNYDVTSSDMVVVINKASGAATTVNLPDSPSTGRLVIVKDGKGDAGSNNITIDGQSKDIDGAGTIAISSNYGVSRVVYNGTQWNVV